jgi:hypothetical protein
MRTVLRERETTHVYHHSDRDGPSMEGREDRKADILKSLE